jgi:hypothetical protein
MYTENRNHITDLAEHTEMLLYKVVYQRYDMSWKMLQTKDILSVGQSVGRSTVVWKFQHLFIWSMKLEEGASLSLQ